MAPTTTSRSARGPPPWLGLIDRLDPEQTAEVEEHALRLVGAGASRFRVLRSFDGPAEDLGARAKQIVRAKIGEDDASR